MTGLRPGTRRPQPNDPLQAWNSTRGVSLGTRIRPALGFWARLRGLMFGPGPGPGEGLYIQPCRQVHMMFMACPLDLLYLGAGGRVVGLVQRIRPWRAGPYLSRALGVLELPAGTLEATGTRLGDIVQVTAAPSPSAPPPAAPAGRDPAPP